MSEFNPIQIVNNQIEAVNPAKQLPAFSSSNAANQVSQLAQSTGAQLASQVQSLSAGVLSVANQQLPFPGKKLVTFFLQTQDGNLVRPSNGAFQPGYLFNMAVNPSSININLPTKTVIPVRTMGGWVLQHWYPDLGSISAEGIIGNLLDRYNTDTSQANNWLNFQKLVTVYQNNGIAYQSGNIPKNNAQFAPTAVLVYDHVTYKGYFENFSYSEEQEQPFTRKYSFSFKFLDMIDVKNIVQLTQNYLTNNLNNALNSNSTISNASSSVSSLSGQQLPI